MIPMQVIEEFVKVGGKVKAVTKLDTTFSIWVTEVRKLQKECGDDHLINPSLKDLRLYYDRAYLPAQAVQTMKPSN